MEQANAASQTFQNENVRFTTHQKPSCILEFDVEALEPLVKAAHQKAIKAVAKHVTLPGFRKGKAPDALVLKNYSKEVDKEWQQAIADQTFYECQKLAQVSILRKEGKITYKIKSYTLSGALLNLDVETEPKVPTIDPKTLQLEAIQRPEVNEEKIEETIRQVQLFFATWHPVTDRPIQEKDFVTLDVDIIEETPPTPLFSKTRFEVTEKSMSKWMYDLVLGKSTGDSIEGVSVPDESASEKDKKELQPKKVKVTIRSIETATYPELTDEFASKLGVKTVEEMRENITNLLNKQADAHVKEAQREQVSEFLLKHYPFDLPHTLVEKEAKFRFQQLMQDPQFPQYWRELGSEEQKNVAKTIFSQSEKAVRMFYLCRNIIAEAKLEISAEDLPPPPNNPLELLMNPQKLFHHQRNPEVEHAEAYARLVLEKANDYLIAEATSES